MDKNELTELQYMEILNKIKKTVDDPNFKPYCYDSEEWGNKFNESNCGFCNDNYATEETASGRGIRSKYYLKDLRTYQRCPFDLRSSVITDYSSGCFYNCFLFGQGKIFKRLNKKSTDIEYIRFLVNKTIEESKTKGKRNMIKIGEDLIFEYKSKWTIATLEDEFYFKTKKEAIDYYCQNCCNPIYNEIHYDCECCPIKEDV